MDLFAFRKPKNELESDEGESKNVPFVPDEMWIKCPKCNTMLLTTDMEENLHVCTKCNHHFRMNGRDRIEMLADKDTFVEFDADLSSHNILDFPGYDEKLEKARKTGAKESVICGECKMNGIDTVLCVMDPTFMMGSMGVITGEKITRAFEYATENAMPIVVCTAAGGARMQEGILSYADGKDFGSIKKTQRCRQSLYHGAYRPDNRRCYGIVCNGGRHYSCRARLPCCLCRSESNRADNPSKAPQGLPNLGICSSEGLYRFGCQQK